MISKIAEEIDLRRVDSHWVITYTAMAGPCEILVRAKNESEAGKMASLAFHETRRIERKFSRYRDDNIIYDINNSKGRAIKVDPELARLLDYSDQCFKLSEGLFDITSGILRKAWVFKGDEIIPDLDLIESLLKRVGWDKVKWDGEYLRLRPDMEIDLGSIGKEYAVDIVAELLYGKAKASLMVNFGGDIRAIMSENDDIPWVVGIENPEKENTAVGQINLLNGGIATSGDLRRFCIVEGKRLGHILNPKTGWPVDNAPRSVTVLGDYCTEAGLLSTLAILRGEGAEKFLSEQNGQYHLIN